jgi:hypothetical protein
MSFTKLNNESTKFITNYIIGTPRNVLLGIGLAHAIQNELYIHIPIIFLTPSVYAGYNAYNNKDNIITWMVEQKKKFRRWY